MITLYTLPNYVNIVLDTLNSNGFEAYIVGGCVRDFLLKRTPHDFDITTNAKPSEILEVFKNFHTIETGLKHGTVTVVVEKVPVEITTYRIDGTYSDGRHPDTVEYTSNLKDDLSRRDFTINAMAYDKNGNLVDEFLGLNDLNLKLIRCVGNPKNRFSEDALRIFRAIRFSSQLNFSIEKDTSYMVHALKDTLKKISVERIAVELNKLIMGDNVHDVLLNYSDVIATVIPEISKCIGFNQHSRYHKYDVWEHIVVSVEKSPKILSIRLAMLLHDIGKPETFTLDKNGNGHFYNHAHVGANITENILKSLKYDNFTIKRVTSLVYHHDDEFNSKYDVKKALSTLGKDTFFELLSVQTSDALAKFDFCRARINHIITVKHMALDILNNNECISLKDLNINGSDLKSLGFTGKSIGDNLNLLLDAVMKEKVINEKSKLIEYIKNPI